MRAVKALQLIRVTLFVLLLIYVGIFHFANDSVVTLPVPFAGSIVVAPTLVVFFALLVSALYTLFLFLPALWRANWARRRLERRVFELQNELTQRTRAFEAELVQLRPPSLPVIPDRSQDGEASDTAMPGQPETPPAKRRSWWRR